MVQPRIQTTVVGSYPVPDWLVAAPSEQALKDAIRVVIDTQRQLGIDLPVDGELYRYDINHPETNGMIEYFVSPLDNVRTRMTRSDIDSFGRQYGMGFRTRPAGVVEGPLGEGTLNLPADYRLSQSLTSGPLKLTLTSPYMLGKTLLDRHYKDRQALVFAIADILAAQVAMIEAAVVQIDEANLPGSPDDGPWVAEAINCILDRVPKTPALHMCFGNYGGQSIQKGHWSKLIDFLNRLHADHVVVELAFRGYDELAYFKDLRPEIGVGLGVIDIKRTVAESPDDVARAIGRAEQVLGEGRVTYVHPDCGFWMLKRNIADAKMRSLVKGRDLYLGSSGNGEG